MALETIGIAVCALGFAFMGAAAIVAPTRVTAQFDVPTLSVAGSNEVRAVYGGFGLAMAAILSLAVLDPALRAGICLTAAAALAGMAAGRALSAAIDRGIGGFPLLYLAIETAAAVMLFTAA